MSEHVFFIDSLSDLILRLEAMHYSKSESEMWTIYSKTLSGVIVKYYAYPSHAKYKAAPVRIRVNYKLLDEGKALKKLNKTLKNLNDRYQETIDHWKTKKKPPEEVKERRWAQLQHFLDGHRELIACFRYQADDRLTEGNQSN